MGVILCPMFRPHDLGEMLRRYRPEQVCGTTAYWQFLLQDAWAAEADLSFLKVPRCGGDVLPAELERRINAFLAQRGCASRLIKEYGMSEDGGIMCVSYGAWEDGDVGRPLPGCRVVAVDPETGALCPPEVQGELLIQSQAVMNGYYRRPEADHQVLKPGPDGTLWVWTKDLGYITADGRVVVTGRKKRMLSRNGFKIFPSVIENCFLEDPQVTACAVVGGKNREGETVPVAYVVPRQGTDPRELEQALHLPDPSGLSLPGRTAPDPQREAGLPYLGGLGCGTGGASIKPVLLVKIAYRQKAAAQRAAAFCGMEAGSSS